MDVLISCYIVWTNYDSGTTFFAQNFRFTYADKTMFVQRTFGSTVKDCHKMSSKSLKEPNARTMQSLTSLTFYWKVLVVNTSNSRIIAN